MSQTSKVEAATVEDANAAGDGHAAGGGASAEAGTAQVDDRDARDSAAESTRPTDEAILSYENQIREEQRQQRPLLGDREPVSALKGEYADGSPVFVAKVADLARKYAALRRTRQDGNCFYRAFLFGVLERILERRDIDTADVLRATVAAWRSKLVEVGFQEIVFEDAHELLIELLDAVRATKEHRRLQEPMSIAELQLRLLDESVANMLIMLVRMITSAEVQRRAEHFAPFILGMVDGAYSPPEFCRRCIEAMGEESDHIQLVAVADAFQVPIRVVYLDNSGAPSAAAAGELSCDEHDFLPSDGPQSGRETKVTVLYRPGHYDLLY